MKRTSAKIERFINTLANLDLTMGEFLDDPELTAKQRKYIHKAQDYVDDAGEALLQISRTPFD